MSNLDQKLRMLVENEIDGVIQNPKYYQTILKKSIEKIGINISSEYDVEFSLTLLAGFLLGRIVSVALLMDIKLNSAQFQEIFELIKRRMREIRVAILEDTHAD